MKTISIVSRKGGVGKSTLAMNLGTVAADAEILAWFKNGRFRVTKQAKMSHQNDGFGSAEIVCQVAILGRIASEALKSQKL